MLNRLFKISLFFVLVVGIFFWLCLNFGLIQHWLVKGRIRQLSGLERETAESEFYARDKAEHLFAGTIAKINRHGEGGVWVWINQGLKYFQVDKYTFYSYFDICNARAKSSDGKFEINDKSREITTDIKQWANWAKTGDFVQLMITRSENGGQVGNLREIYAYSFPLFLPLDLRRLCTN